MAPVMQDRRRVVIAATDYLAASSTRQLGVAVMTVRRLRPYDLKARLSRCRRDQNLDEVLQLHANPEAPRNEAGPLTCDRMPSW